MSTEPSIEARIAYHERQKRVQGGKGDLLGASQHASKARKLRAALPPAPDLYRTRPATDFTHYSAAELNDFHATDGFDVTLPVSGDKTAEGLDALPNGAVVLADTIAYQKCGDHWDGAGQTWDTGQLVSGLPARAIHWGTE